MPHVPKSRMIGETTWVRTPRKVKLRPSPRFARRLAAALSILRESVWSKVLGKALGIAFGMLALAAIGALATARGLGSHKTVLAEPSASPSARPLSRHAPVAAGMTAAAPAGASATAAPKAARSEGVTADGKVILNRASAEDLQRLPGVGAKRAQAILALREKLGRFRRPTDLLRIKGIGPKSLKRLTPLFVLDPPQSPEPPPSDGEKPAPAEGAKPSASKGAGAAPPGEDEAAPPPS